MTSGVNIRDRVNRGMAWVAMASSVIGVLDFVSFVLILKFWISQADFGIWAVVGTLFVAIELAAELGLTAAIVQRDDHSDVKLSTVFWLNVILAVVFYGVVAGIAPLLAALYDRPIIVPLMLVFGANLLVRATYQVPYALMHRELRFGETSAVRVVANLADVSARVGFAAAGFGVWCFVIGVMARNVVMAVGIQLRHWWWPKWVLRPREAREYVRFGLRSSASKMLFQIYTNLDYHVVMYFFGAAATGIYRAAYDLVLEPIKYLSNIITGVGFAAFSRLKSDRVAIVDQFVAFSRQNLVVICTLLAVILLTAEDLLLVLTKPSYVEGATAARILAIVGVLRAMSYISPPLLDGLGFPGRTLRYQVVAAVLVPATFVACAAGFRGEGFVSVAIGWAIAYPIAFGVLAWMTFEVLELSPLAYLRRIGGVPLSIAAATAVAFPARMLVEDLAPALRLAIVAGAVMAAIGASLAIFQGISPRSIWRALRGGEATGLPSPPG